MQQDDVNDDLLALVLVSSARSNVKRRRACRNTWFRYVSDTDSPLDERLRARLALRFLIAGGGSGGGDAPAAAPDGDAAAAARKEEADAAAAEAAALAAEAAEHGDLLVVDAREGYAHLWRKTLAALRAVRCGGGGDSSGSGGASGLPPGIGRFAYFFHADDDSFVRLDLLAPLLEASPRERFYWGYIWNGGGGGGGAGGGGRTTAPIRDARNKSHMPHEQYPEDAYPPFASGCGFALSADLVDALLAAPLPDYRLLDPPFGIHLCGAGPRCVLASPVTPVHDARVRPYRGLPIFDAATVVQHYLAPEEMAPFYRAARAAAAEAAAGGAGGASTSSGGGGGGEQGAPAELYAQLVAMGLLRR